MAYPIAEYPRQLFAEEYHQSVILTVNTLKESFTLTDSDVVAGSLSINRYSVAGERIEIGSATAAELRLKLNNINGRFNSVSFEGAEVYVQVGVRKSDAVGEEDGNWHYVPMGYFRVDEPPRKRGTVSIVALDRMMQFGRAVEPGMIIFPIRVDDLLDRLCYLCDVTSATDFGTLPNHTYVIPAAPEGNLTCRQYLSWAAELTGSCAWIDWEGKLRLSWYDGNSGTLTASQRYSSELDENPITITGVQIVSGEDVYLEGSGEYCINIEDNPLVQSSQRTLVQSLYRKLNGFSYVPFKASVVSMPHIYPMDVMRFQDANGNSLPIIITDVTYTLNCNTSLQGKGQSLVRNGYATTPGFTRKESNIISTLKRKQKDILNERTSSVLEFNRLIGNAMGLHSTPYTQADGSTIYYMHDAPNLEESKLIYTMTAQGVAWTDSGWNDGNPVWSYGATGAGDALFRKLSAEGISVSKVGEDYEIQITPRAFAIRYRGMTVTEINADEMSIPNASISHYLQIGKIRWVPAINDGTLIGTDLVYIE